MTWDRCLDDGYIRKSFIDKQRAKSLRGISEKKHAFVKKTEITEDNAPILFSEMYDSLLEICQSISCLEGYNVLNHKCMRHFLERLDLHSIAERFDRFRKIRNNINYYGKDIETGFAKASISEMD
ncbi:MAG: hypothetical protein KKC05_00075, partial [Nanoarchaeota archaeon]|nr:hypothetical protein [Nanoarchaeota archaeon]